MTTLNISLPKAMREFIDKQIAEEAVEVLLLEGLQSEGREMTRDDWKELRRRVQERHAKRKAQ